MKKFILCVLLSGVAVVYSAPDEGAQSAIHLLFNGQVSAADSVINTGMQANPHHPQFFFLKAHHAFYMRYFSTQQVDRDSILQVIVEHAEKAVKIGKDAPQTTEIKFFIGSAYGLLSRAYIMQRELWDGYWAAIDCENYLEEVLEEDPDFTDAYVGLGVLEYYPAQLTGFQAFASWIGGFGGDAEKGLAYFENTAQNGRLLKTEANFILATMNRFIEVNFQEADKYFAQLNQQYPDNNWIANQYQQTQLAHTIDANGVETFVANIDSFRIVYNINNSNVLNGIGYNFMGLERYEIAEPLLKLNIELYPDEANPYDSMSECYENLGEIEKSLAYAKQGLEKIETDTVATEAFRENLKTILDERIARLE